MLHNRKVKTSMFNLITIILTILVVLLFIIKIFFFDCIKVKGESMKPTLINQQLVIIKKQKSNIDRGMVVVMNSPEAGYVVKRIIAINGDCVQIINGSLLVNGLFYANVLTQDAEWDIPQDAIFVVGDNINYSTDSRDWGPISINNIIGIVVYPLTYD